jgi:hypothetical protein
MPFFVVPIRKSVLSHDYDVQSPPTDEALTQFHLFQTVHLLVYIEDNMCPIRDEDATLGLQAMFLQRLQLLEEARHVDHAATSDDVDAAWVHETRRQDVEVVGNAVCDNCVAGVVSALGAAADLRFVGEDVGELALAFVAPLGTEDNGDGHVRGTRERAGTAVKRVLVLGGTRSTAC